MFGDHLPHDLFPRMQQLDLIELASETVRFDHFADNFSYGFVVGKFHSQFKGQRVKGKVKVFSWS